MRMKPSFQEGTKMNNNVDPNCKGVDLMFTYPNVVKMERSIRESNRVKLYVPKMRSICARCPTVCNISQMTKCRINENAINAN